MIELLIQFFLKKNLLIGCWFLTLCRLCRWWCGNCFYPRFRRLVKDRWPLLLWPWWFSICCRQIERIDKIQGIPGNKLSLRNLSFNTGLYDFGLHLSHLIRTLLQVPPAELEQLLQAHQEIADAAVIPYVLLVSHPILILHLLTFTWSSTQMHNIIKSSILKSEKIMNFFPKWND